MTTGSRFKDRRWPTWVGKGRDGKSNFSTQKEDGEEPTWNRYKPSWQMCQHSYAGGVYNLDNTRRRDQITGDQEIVRPCARQSKKERSAAERVQVLSKQAKSRGGAIEREICELAPRVNATTAKQAKSRGGAIEREICELAPRVSAINAKQAKSRGGAIERA